MKYIEYLYVKYYFFQVRMGNADIAPFSSMLIISFSFILYCFSAFFYIIIFFEDIWLDISYFLPISIAFFFSVIVCFYFLLVFNGKFKKILKKKDLKDSSNLGAILFPVVAFLLFTLGWMSKMFFNQVF